MKILKVLLAHKTVRQFFKFGVIGAIGFVFDTALVYSGIYILGIDPIYAPYFSFPFVVTFTWLGNRFFTFRDAKREKIAQQLMRFVTVCSVGLVFNRGTVTLLMTNIPFVYQHPVFGLIAGTGVGMFFNFFTSKKLVFR
ncbi:MAG: GtrA family protein [Alphaproteobacteria bacterium]